MSNTADDLWPESLKPAAVSPVALLRTQGARLKERTRGLLEGVVESEQRGTSRIEHSFAVYAPALDYRRGILRVTHQSPGAYPATVESLILVDPDEEEPEDDLLSRDCATQADFTEALREILRSKRMSSLLDSLLAQINDSGAVPVPA